MEAGVNHIETIELFREPGEARALLDIDCERVEVELLPADADTPDRVWLSVSETADDDACVHTARLTPDQSIRLGRWLVAAGEAALGD
jgi:hypothetical protein